jgi:hypothetical protein
MTHSHETNPPNPNVFSQINVWYSDEPLVVTPEERAVLAASAQEYDQFAATVAEIAPAVRRHMHGEMPDPSDPEPLGGDAGVEVSAYGIEHNGRQYVARFPKGPDAGESVEGIKQRLRNLARARVFTIPHLEVLSAHTLVEEPVVITEWAQGVPANELSPHTIEAVPERILASLQQTAIKMEAAGLALDIIWGAEGIEAEEPLKRVVSHYDEATGPTYFDITNTEEDEERINEAGRHFAELVTAMVATGVPLDPEATAYRQLTFREVAARIALFDRAYRTIQQLWPESTGLGWLERTTGRMIQTLSPLEGGLLIGRGDRYTLPLTYRQDYSL